MKLYLSRCFINIVKSSDIISITVNTTIGVIVGVTISITINIIVKDSEFYPVAITIIIYIYIFIINDAK